MLLVQGRGEMAVLPAVTAVLLHRSAFDTWSAICLLQGGGELVVLPHHNAMHKWNVCSILSTF